MTPEEIVGLTWEGLKKFDGNTAVYIRPMYWAEHGGYMGVPADPASTRFCLCLYEAPMIAPTGFSMTVSPFRRPTHRNDADRRQGRLPLSQQRPRHPRGADARLRQCAGAGHAGQRRRDRLPPTFSWSRTAQVLTPAANGTFLSGITRSRTMALLGEARLAAGRADAFGARFPGGRRDLFDRQPFEGRAGHQDRGSPPAARARWRKKARDLYWDWAHSTSPPEARLPGGAARVGRVAESEFAHYLVRQQLPDFCDEGV